MKCQAKRQDGEPCKAWAVQGSTVCRVHGAGGRALEKTVAVNTKHGRYSRYSPPPLLKGYEQLLADPNHLDLSDEIALLRASVQELLGSLDKAPENLPALPPLLEAVSRVVERENKRRATLNANQAVVFVARLVDLLRETLAECISNPDERAAAIEHFRVGCARQFGPAVPGAPGA